MQCPKKMHEKREKSQPRLNQNMAKFFDGQISFGGVANDVPIVAAGVGGGTFAQNSFTTSPVACKQHKQMASLTGSTTEAPTRFLVNCTIRYLVSHRFFRRLKRQLYIIVAMGARHSRLYQTWTLWVGCLSFLAICRIWHPVWTGYEPWCAVWTRCLTADQQYPVDYHLGQEVRYFYGRGLLEESMVARLR